MSKRLVNFLLDEIQKAKAEAMALRKINEVLNEKLKEKQDDE